MGTSSSRIDFFIYEEGLYSKVNEIQEHRFYHKQHL